MSCSTRQTRKKAQTSIEFVVLMGFLVLIFLMLFIVIENKSVSAAGTKNLGKLREMQHVIVAEFDYAAGALHGYSRVFNIPDTINGVDYAVELVDGQEVVMAMQGQELVAFLNVNVTGNLTKGNNLIQKQASEIIVGPAP